MKKSKILAEELTKTANAVIGKERRLSSFSGPNKLKALTKRLEGVAGFSQKLISILNEIIEQKSMTFTQEEKEKLIEDLKPTMGELIAKYSKH